jgi:hypothetical protein
MARRIALNGTSFCADVPGGVRSLGGGDVLLNNLQFGGEPDAVRQLIPPRTDQVEAEFSTANGVRCESVSFPEPWGKHEPVQDSFAPTDFGRARLRSEWRGAIEVKTYYIQGIEREPQQL